MHKIIFQLSAFLFSAAFFFTSSIRVTATESQPAYPGERQMVYFFLLDVSASMNENLDGTRRSSTDSLKNVKRVQMNEVIVDFIRRVPLDDNPRILLFSVGEAFKKFPGVSDIVLKDERDRTTLINALNKAYGADCTETQTLLYDSVSSILDVIDGFIKSNPNAMCSLFVYTDGQDNKSRMTLDALLKRCAGLKLNPDWNHFSAQLAFIGKGNTSELKEIAKNIGGSCPSDGRAEPPPAPKHVRCNPSKIILDSFQTNPRQTVEMTLEFGNDLELPGYEFVLNVSELSGIIAEPSIFSAKRGVQKINFRVSGQDGLLEKQGSICISPRKVDPKARDLMLSVTPRIIPVQVKAPAPPGLKIQGSSQAVKNIVAKYTAVTEGGIQSLRWELGHGKSWSDVGEGESTQIKFPEEGIYEVKATATGKGKDSAGNFCKSETKMRVLVVGDLAVNFKALPEPMFTGIHEIACEPVGKFTKIAWNVEGTKYEGSTSIRHNFQKQGEYQISVEIISEDGRKSQNSVKAVVYPKAMLAVSSPANNATLFTLQALPFKIESMSNFRNVNWEVDGAGAKTKLMGGHAEHVFDKEGEYSISVTAEPLAGGGTIGTELKVKVVPLPRLLIERPAAYSIVKSDQPAEFAIQKDSAPMFKDIEWRFPDGTTKKGTSVLHSFRGSGDITATVKGVSNDGIEVLENLALTIAANPILIEPPKGPYRFNTDIVFKVDAEPEAVEWTFGDGEQTRTSASNVSHRFKRCGEFNITALLKFPGGRESTSSALIKIEEVKAVADPQIISGGKQAAYVFIGSGIILKNSDEAQKTDIVSSEWFHKAPDNKEYEKLSSTSMSFEGKKSIGEHRFKLLVKGAIGPDGIQVKSEKELSLLVSKKPDWILFSAVSVFLLFLLWAGGRIFFGNGLGNLAVKYNDYEKEISPEEIISRKNLDFKRLRVTSWNYWTKTGSAEVRIKEEKRPVKFRHGKGSSPMNFFDAEEGRFDRPSDDMLIFHRENPELKVHLYILVEKNKLPSFNRPGDMAAFIALLVLLFGLAWAAYHAFITGQLALF